MIKSVLQYFQLLSTAWGVRRFARRCRSRRKKSILVTRFEALGDVIWLTAAMNALKQQRSDCEVAFLTNRRHRSLLKQMKLAATPYYVHTSNEQKSKKLAQYFDEQYRPESDSYPKTKHLMHIFCEDLNINPVSLNPSFNYEILHAAQTIKTTRATPKLVVHLGPTWKVRSIDIKTVNAVLEKLKSHFPTLEIVQVGKTHPTFEVASITLKGAVTKINTQTIQGLIAEIIEATVFLGIDSGPLHIAAAAQVPIVGLFSSTTPGFRLPFNSVSQGISSSVACVGCHHRFPREHERESCIHGVECIYSYSADEIFQTVSSIIEQNMHS